MLTHFTNNKRVYFPFSFFNRPIRANRFSIIMVVFGFIMIVQTLGLAVIQISSINDLQKIGNDPAYPLNGEYELTQDIDASGFYFMPIGSPTNPFTGTFDGKGCEITGLNDIRPAEPGGLFSCVGSGGEIKNLGIDNCSVYFMKYSGVLVGKNYGTISNCYVKCSAVGNQKVGGLVGVNYGTVLNCFTSGSIGYCSDTVGGLIGLNYGTVLNSHSASSVSANIGVVGGLIGYNGIGGTISNCYSSGSAVATDDMSGEFGGLVGENTGEISNSYSLAFVSEYAGPIGSNEIGGLVGRNRGPIRHCYSAGFVKNYHLYILVGGLTGRGGNVYNSYWDIEASGQSSSSGGVGKTTAEMKKQATFVGWDFANTWRIIEDTTYPYLYWQYVVPEVVGTSQNWAEDMITEGAGLVIGTIDHQCSNTVPAGKIISQSPAAGVQLLPGSAVDLVVSTGPCMVATINNIPSQYNVYRGANLLLVAEVQGGSGTLHYQWYFEFGGEKNAKAGGEPIPGANGNTLLLLNLQEANTGWYWCQVSDDYDVVETPRVHITVEDAGMSVISGYVILVAVITMMFVGLYRIHSRSVAKE